MTTPSKYILIHILNPISYSEDVKSKNRRLNRSDLKTYTCRDKTYKAIEHILPSQTPPLSLIPVETCGEPFSTFDSSNSKSSTNDLDIHIVVRKGVRACTKHPISSFVSYDSLSLTYRAFVLSLSSISIPEGWQEAINYPSGKNP